MTAVINKKAFMASLPFVGLIAVTIVFTIMTNGRFISAKNLELIMNQSYTVVLVAIGVTFIFTHGGIDFSVGAVLAMAQMLGAYMLLWTDSAFAAYAAIFVTALICGSITAGITVGFGLPPFIASLCMQFMCRGIINTAISASGVGANQLAVAGWTVRLIVLGLVVVGAFLLHTRTKIGIYNKAIGENQLAATASGVNSKQYKYIAYLISAVTLSIASSFDLSRTGIMNTSTGMGLEMDVIIAVCLGGLSLRGGYGASVRCAVIGGVLIAALTNGFILIGVHSNYFGLIKCVVFIIVIMFTFKRNVSGFMPR